MSIRITLQPEIELDRDFLLNAIKEEIAGSGPGISQVEEFYDPSSSMNSTQSWEDLITRPNQTLTKTISWKEM